MRLSVLSPRVMSQTQPNPSIFKSGDPVQFFDLRRRTHGSVLTPGGTTDVRGEVIEHDHVIGRANGCRVQSRRKRPFWAYVPTLPEFTLAMGRAATIIYPKDAAYIVMHGDIASGMTVVEGGAGSGALSMALLRAVGPTGQVITYDLRQESLNRARKNVEAFLGPQPNHDLQLGDIYRRIGVPTADRIVLDVPEPWQVLDGAAQVLVDGGILVAYLPTILQVHTHVNAVREHPDYFVTETVEVLERKWHLAEQSARPMHQMVGHTGFICVSRRIGRPDASIAHGLA
ncbi:MAG: methyltransferase domain-containing protein [Myxococcota bacterium]|nr:methyltransferase domain-containing protein [Myxococcota bacterium]